MEDAAGSESALCGFKSRSPYHFSDLMRSCRRASIPPWVSRSLVQLAGTAAHDPQVAGLNPAIPTNSMP